MTKLQEWENQIVCGDCLELMKQLPDGCVDLVVTDPPYWDLHGYGGEGIGKNQNYEDYIESLWNVHKELFRITADDGSYFLNIMDLRRNERILRISHRMIHQAQREGWQLADEITWFVPNKMSSPSDRFLVNKKETILHFVKTSHFFFEKSPIRISHSDWAKGDKRAWKYRRDGKCPGNVWVISAHHLPNPEHPAMFPIQIPRRCILGWSRPDSITLDPFIGSGRTAVAAKQLNRRFIGFEINESYCKIARERLKQEEMDFKPMSTLPMRD